jgi:hypothetical protein
MSAFGRSKTPKAHSTVATACTVRRNLPPQPAAAKAMTAASSQDVANSMSRQMMPTKTNAGGASARMGTSAANQTDRRAIVNASTPKPTQ